MALTVYKYEVPVEDDFVLWLPTGAQLLSFQAQHEKPCLWALVDPEARTEKRGFRLASTGHKIDLARESLRFVGSAQLHGGALVFHLFEVTS